MIKIFEYQNSQIQFEVIDGQVMANATHMFKANNSRLDKWKESNPTKRYLEAVTLKWGIDENQLVITKKGGSDQGTWIHEKLILNAARYISVEFELWCDEKIAELMATGRVQIEKPKTPAELLLEQAQMLVDHERKISEMESKVNYLLEDKMKAEEELRALPVSEEDAPEESMRAKVRRLVNVYSRAKQLSQHDVWASVYEKLYYRYSVSIKSYAKSAKESLIDVAERTGHLEKMYNIISKMVKDSNITVVYDPV